MNGSSEGSLMPSVIFSSLKDEVGLGVSSRYLGAPKRAKLTDLKITQTEAYLKTYTLPLPKPITTSHTFDYDVYIW